MAHNVSQGATTGGLHTRFAPAERATSAVVERQAQRFLEISPLLRQILDAVPDLLITLNKHRQIVFANRSLLDFVQRDEAAVRGLRPGEALDCIHTTVETGGCGTSEFCSTCGAARAILRCQDGEADVQDCRITRRPNNEALDLRVSATPLWTGSEEFTLFTLTDISHETRRRALERIFFHDILNTLTAMRACSDLLLRADMEDVEELSEVMHRLTYRMIEEITLQRQLTDAETGELVVTPVEIDTPALLAEVAGTYRHHEVGRGRHIALEPSSEPVALVSDPAVLRRVLSNMLKNALEATPEGETVSLGCRASEGGVEFWVHNPGVMPRAVQLQVFQRSFSTKGAGRGLGTYSIKLLSERYLRGSVWFTSTAEAGTTFRAWYPPRLIKD